MNEKILVSIKESVDSLNKKVDHIEVTMVTLATKESVEALETRFDGLETRFGGLETQFVGLNHKVDVLIVNQEDMIESLAFLKDHAVSKVEYKRDIQLIQEQINHIYAKI